MRNILINALLLFGCLISASPVSAGGDKQTFIIVHGATGGGWDWRTVSETLIQRGHSVYRPTLTGLGERFHLAGPDVNLDTHISDIVNLILFEDLQQVVLVGHSYGGMVLTGVMNEIPERIKHATFLDAAVPGHGMSAMETWGGKFSDYPIEDHLVKFPWVDPSLPYPRDVYHPANTISQAVSFDNPKAKTINVSYVAFVPEEMTMAARSEDPSWRRAASRGWTIRTFAGDHVIYRVKPTEMAQLLIDTISDVNDPID
ncbi:alpha/beta hydrolase [Arenicella xantha]|uniref:Pimeloyl-ACP methyl ester carboxylesterase n=1 Tax=Arenicella xantha TaxID=644221 RepID=A0A395JPB3_9GAMM|nr:alpha/beta fold hydrolase [Arenicella xantha]RBP53449.1 pimeloyl-ACP methyl ester carboxylesterase [Arenicella xantha]